MILGCNVRYLYHQVCSYLHCSGHVYVMLFSDVQFAEISSVICSHCGYAYIIYHQCLHTSPARCLAAYATTCTDHPVWYVFIEREAGMCVQVMLMCWRMTSSCLAALWAKSSSLCKQMSSAQCHNRHYGSRAASLLGLKLKHGSAQSGYEASATTGTRVFCNALKDP